MTESKPRKKRVASKRKGVKPKRQTLSQYAKAKAKRERVRKDTHARDARMKAVNAVKLTCYINAEARVKLDALCKSKSMTQAQVLIAALMALDDNTLVKPLGPVVESRIEEVKRKLAALTNKG